MPKVERKLDVRYNLWMEEEVWREVKKMAEVDERSEAQMLRVIIRAGLDRLREEISAKTAQRRRKIS